MKNDILKDVIKDMLIKNKTQTVILFFSIILVVLTSLLPPQILRIIIDNNFKNRTVDRLLLMAFLYFFTLLFNKIFEVIKEVSLSILGQKSVKSIRMRMIKKMRKLNASYFTKNDSGYITSRIINDVDAIASLFSEGLVGIMVDALKIIGIIFSIYTFSKNLALLVLIFAPIIFFITNFFKNQMKSLQTENMKVIAKINNYISETFKNIVTIKSFAKEEYVEEKYCNLVTESSNNFQKLYLYDSVYPSIITMIKTVIIIILILISYKDIGVMGITLGMVVASVELISNIFQPIESLGMEFTQIQKAFSGIERVNDFLNEEEDDEKDKTVKYTDVIKDNLVVCFNNVSFTYDNENYVLEDINLEFKDNEKVTFVGRTGVGKSTLFKLLLGVLKPTKGNITINGIDVFSIENTEKRKLFRYVDQSFFTVYGTIRDQITLYDDTITDEAIDYAIKFSGLTEFIDMQKDGINTMVNEDVIFSKGEEQLFSIARAIVFNPKILILDEITANLDSVTEERIVNVLRKASNNRMIFSISHRLSSMLNNDKIIELRDGKLYKITNINGG